MSKGAVVFFAVIAGMPSLGHAYDPHKASQDFNPVSESEIEGYDDPDQMGLQRRPMHNYWAQVGLGYTYTDLAGVQSDGLYPQSFDPSGHGTFLTLAAGVRFDRHFMIGLRASGSGMSDFGLGSLLIDSSFRIRRIGRVEPFTHLAMGYSWSVVSDAIDPRIVDTKVGGLTGVIGAGADIFLEHWFSLGFGFDFVGLLMTRGAENLPPTDATATELNNSGSSIGFQFKLEVLRVGLHFL